jgi:phage I-like protein
MQKINTRAIDLNTAREPPDEFRLLPLGEYPTEKGTFRLDVAAAERVLEDFKRRGTDLSIDYEHESVLGKALGATPAAGWISELELRADGLWATSVTWTNKAAEYLRNREYRYHSPSFFADEQGNILSITSPALTNRPASHNIVPLVASREDKPMPDNQLAPIMTALSLNTAASADDAVARITELHTLRQDVLTLTGVETLNAARGVLTAWQTAHEQLPTVTSERDALATRLEQGKRETLITAALDAGTLSPAQAAEGGFARVVPLETLETFLRTAPKVVSLEAAKPPAKNQTTLSDDEALVAKMLGVNAGVFKEAN